MCAYGMKASDEQGEGLTDAELLDQAMTLFFAGHETTANALAWAWFLLARNPDVTRRLQADLRQVAGGGRLTVTHLGGLPYLEQVVKECMRRLPSVWAFMKEPVDDLVVRGCRIPAGSPILFSSYVVHHDPRWYPEPDRFDPSRFEPDAERALPRGAYTPFSGGSRVCLGKAFAMMEMKIILGTMLQRIDPVVPAGHEPELLAELSLHPRGGLPFEVHLRPTSGV